MLKDRLIPTKSQEEAC